jgi:hypothetical protein
MHYAHEQLDPHCIYEFIDCERNLDCLFCELASSRSGITRLSSYISQIIDDQGLEKALEYYNKLRYIFGSGTATAMKEKIGDKPISPEILKNVLSGNYTGFGMGFEVETGSDSIEITIKKCPIYEELSKAGLENSVIRQFCDQGSKGEHAAITSVFPDLEPYSMHRKDTNIVCKEGYRIKKK